MGGWFENRKARDGVQFVHIPLTEDVEVEGNPPADRDGQRFEMAVSSSELAAMYALKGWQIAGARGPHSIPDAYELLGILLNLAESLKKPAATYNTTGRLMAVKDSDFPGALDFYLYVGHMHTDPPTDENEVDPFDELRPV